MDKRNPNKLQRKNKNVKKKEKEKKKKKKKENQTWMWWMSLDNFHKIQMVFTKERVHGGRELDKFLRGGQI